MQKFSKHILTLLAALTIYCSCNAQNNHTFKSEKLKATISADANMDIALDNGKQYSIQNEHICITLQRNPLINNDANSSYQAIKGNIQKFASELNLDIDNASLGKTIINSNDKTIYALSCIDNNSKMQCIFAISAYGKNSILSVSMFEKEYEPVVRTIISTIKSL